MDAVFVGIDVAKDKLDVAVRPSGERFVVARTEAGLAELKNRLGIAPPREAEEDEPAKRLFPAVRGRP